MCLKAFLFKQKHTHKHIQSKMIRRFMVCFLSFLFMVLCSFLFMLAPFMSSLSEFCLCGCLIEVNMFVLLALCVVSLPVNMFICFIVFSSHSVLGPCLFSLLLTLCVNSLLFYFDSPLSHGIWLVCLPLSHHV